MKIEKGDLVQLNGIWKKRVGVVLALDNSWYVPNKHIDACNCIVNLTDVKLLKKQVIPKQYLKHLA